MWSTVAFNLLNPSVSCDSSKVSGVNICLLYSELPKKGALLPLHLKYALQYSNRMVQGNKLELVLNGTLKLVAHADYEIILWKTKVRTRKLQNLY